MVVVLTLAMLTTAVPTHANTTTLHATQDSVISHIAKNTNDGASESIHLNRIGRTRGLVSFDLTTIPLDKLVKAKLILTIQDHAFSSKRKPFFKFKYHHFFRKHGEDQVTVHRLLQGWTEGEGGKKPGVWFGKQFGWKPDLGLVKLGAYKKRYGGQKAFNLNKRFEVQKRFSPKKKFNKKKFKHKPKPRPKPEPVPGVTWNCATDENIRNFFKRDCPNSERWNGGAFAQATAEGVPHPQGTTGEVEWNVTADVLAGAVHGWLIKQENEKKFGQVKYWSKEGAQARGDPTLGPRLILELDTTPPALTTPNDITVAAINADGTPATNAAIEAFLNAATAHDAVDGLITPTNNAPTIFPLGPTTVTFTATDAHGNTSTASAKVTVNVEDQTPPTVQAPADITISAVDASGTPASDAAIQAFLNGVNANDNIDGPLVPSDNAPDVFPLGLTLVTFLATDAAGNSNTATATVTIEDQTPPDLTVPGPITIPAFNAQGTALDDPDLQAFFAQAMAEDNVDGSITPTHNAPNPLPLGETVITFTAQDAAGNTSTATVMMNIADLTPPTLLVFGAPTVAALDANGTPGTDPGVQGVINGVVASDNVDGLITPTNDAPDQFPLGKTIVNFAATDAAGNEATAAVPITVEDQTPPEVTSPSDLTVAAKNAFGIPTDDSAFSAFFQGGTATDNVDGPLTPNPTVPTLFPLGQTSVPFIAMDVAGNEGMATAMVTVEDQQPPVVAITEPTTGTIFTRSPLTVTGTIDDPAATVQVNGIEAVINNDTFTATDVPLTEGANTLTALATDPNNNTGTASVNVTLRIPPEVTILEPENLAVTSEQVVTVRLTTNEAATVRVNGIPAVAEGLVFTAANVPLIEGNNVLTASATDPTGAVGTASIQITKDRTPPVVTIDSPTDGFVTNSASMTITGMINDVVVGTVNGDQAEVTVNGIAADVSNRSYLAADVPLVPGINTITAIGVDQGGNSAQTSIIVTRQDLTGHPQLNLVSGNNQSATISSPLPDPLIVALTNSTGLPVPNQTVIFEIKEGDGTITNGTTARAVLATTNAQGQAEVQWTLGTHAGAGNQRVEAHAVGFAGRAIITASAEGGPATQIVADNGNQQVGPVGQPLPRPLAVVVTDEGHNRLPNVPVTFSVETGGGSFNGQPSLLVNTDMNGSAFAVLTLGVEEGADNNVVKATFPGNTGLSVQFRASAQIPGDPAATRVSGVVLDNTNRPIEGVTVSIPDTTLVTQSNVQGQFVLEPAPVGHIHLRADGITAQRPGTWPTLEFELVTIAGRDNTLGMPVYLLPLDIPKGLLVDETTGGTLTLPEVPGFALTIEPGSATFPDGAKTGLVSVTVVHPDKIPMPPNFGQQPRFIITIQPPGVVFDPPAPLTMPNLDGLGPGEVTELYSFDHDQGQFVAIGTGTVSEDGTVIQSDPGVGITKGGWHCGGNPQRNGQSGSLDLQVFPTEVLLVPGQSVELKASGRPPLNGIYTWVLNPNDDTPADFASLTFEDPAPPCLSGNEATLIENCSATLTAKEKKDSPLGQQNNNGEEDNNGEGPPPPAGEVEVGFVCTTTGQQAEPKKVKVHLIDNITLLLGTDDENETDINRFGNEIDFLTDNWVGADDHRILNVLKLKGPPDTTLVFDLAFENLEDEDEGKGEGKITIIQKKVTITTDKTGAGHTLFEIRGETHSKFIEDIEVQAKFKGVVVARQTLTVFKFFLNEVSGGAGFVPLNPAIVNSVEGQRGGNLFGSTTLTPDGDLEAIENDRPGDLSKPPFKEFGLLTADTIEVVWGRELQGEVKISSDGASHGLVFPQKNEDSSINSIEHVSTNLRMRDLGLPEGLANGNRVNYYLGHPTALSPFLPALPQNHAGSVQAKIAEHIEFPVVVHLLKGPTLNSRLDQKEAQELMDDVNKIWSQAGIGFRVRVEEVTLDSDELLIVTTFGIPPENLTGEVDDVLTLENVDGAINIYFVDILINGFSDSNPEDERSAGVAGLTIDDTFLRATIGSPKGGSIVERNFDDGIWTKTAAHEIGHYLFNTGFTEGIYDSIFDGGIGHSDEKLNLMFANALNINLDITESQAFDARERILFSTTVNSFNDRDDDRCDEEHCSLREAINAANRLPGIDTIDFVLKAPATMEFTAIRTIQLQKPLPPILGPVIIKGPKDGSVTVKGPGDPVDLSGVVLDGSQAGLTCGFEIKGLGPPSTIKNLVIKNFKGPAICISFAASNGNVIEGNTLLGNQGGILINTSSNQIGGARKGVCLSPCNLIIQNKEYGVRIEGALTQMNRIEGNFIGVDIFGEPAGNQEAGVLIAGRTSDNMIGSSTDSKAGNLIAFNGRGVLIKDDSQDNRVGFNNIFNNIEQGVLIKDESQDNRVRFNNIFNNGGLGIDLQGGQNEDPNTGVTPPDTGDADTGPNNHQNFPILSAAKYFPQTSELVVFGGILDQPRGDGISVDLFSNVECDGSQFGEGQRFLGSKSFFATGPIVGGGPERISALIPIADPAIQQLFENELEPFITMTATRNLFAGTSEFSNCVRLEVTEGG